MKEKFKELTKDTAVYGISTIFSRFLTFILVPFYTHVFRADQYGIVTNIYAYIAFLNVVFLYGMDSAYLKYVSMKEETDKKDIFSTPFLCVVLTSVIFSVLLLLFRSPVNMAIDIPASHSGLLYYFVLVLTLDALSIIPFAYLRIKRKAKKFALIKTLNIVINVALNLILIPGMKMGIEAVFISNLFASAFTLIALIPDIAENLRLNITGSTLIKMLKFGLPYLPAGLASMVIQVIDRPILLAMTDRTTVGIYQANYKLGIFMMLFVSMFQYAWQPFFLNNAKEENAKEIFSRVLTFFTLAGSLVLVFLSLFIDDIVKLNVFHRPIIGAAYWGGLSIIPIVLLGYLFNGIYVNFTAGIFIKEKTKYIPYVTGTGALVNVVVNYALIPSLGMTGAALATLFSYFVMALGLFFVSQRFYRINYEYGKLLRIFIAVLITAVIYYKFAIGNILLKVLTLIAFFVMILGLRIIKTGEITSILKTFRRRTARQHA